MATTAEQLKQQAQHVKEKFQEQAPNRSQLVGAVTILTIIGVLGAVAAVVVGGLAVVAAVVTPVLVVLSPVLVPAATVGMLVLGGLMAAGVSCVAVVSGVRWVYQYCQGRHPVGSDRVDAARRRFMEYGSHLKERASGVVDATHDNLQAIKNQ